MKFDTRPRIEIIAPDDVRDRVIQNIEEGTAAAADVAIHVIESNPSPYVRREGYDFEHIRTTPSKTEYFRYGELKRTIENYGDTYLITTSLPQDEEGVLLCMREAMRNEGEAYIHGELLEYGGKGILITGEQRSGKTSLLIRLLSEFKADFIGDETVRVCDNMGEYVPHTVFVRINDILEAGLQEFTEDISLTNASQYMDQKRVNGIMDKKLYEIDAGLVFSRETFCSALGVQSRAETMIERVVNTSYGPGYHISEEDGKVGIRFDDAWSIPREELGRLVE